MQKLKIAIVVDLFPTVSETFIVNQINSIIGAGHTVQVVAFQKGNIEFLHSSLKTNDLLSNVIYFQKKVESRSRRYFIFQTWFFQNFFKIRWNEFANALNVFKHGKKALSLELFFASQVFLTGEGFDIIHAHFGPIAERVAVLKSQGFLRKSKLITTFHGFDLIPNNAEVYKKIYKNLLSESSAITFNSEYLKNIFSTLNCEGCKIYILPMGLDTSFFKRSAATKNDATFELLFCGRLIALKGPDIAVNILKELILRGHQNVKLTIIGEGPLKENLFEQIEKDQLNNNIYLTGALSQDAIKKKMEQAQVFLMPGTHEPVTNRAETQGLVLQEAQAMELPVIISDVGGMKYGMIPNETGFVIEEGNISGFADTIERLMKDKHLCKTMGENGREYVVTNFDNKVLCNRLIKIYQSVLKQ